MAKSMFYNLEKTIKDMSKGMTYQMEIIPDEDGYLDKECPNEECTSKFKVQSDDWVGCVQGRNAFCPFCGHEADYEQWFTTEQINQAKSQAIEYVSSLIGDALKKDARRSGLKYKGNRHFYNLPAKTLDSMQQRITCIECGFRYAIIGSAYFCPCCGANTSTQTYTSMMDKAKSVINNVDNIRMTIADKDAAEQCCETLLIGVLNELVTTVQHVCESIYKDRFPEQPIKQNTFQRLDEGSKLWKEAVGEGYQDWLSEEEYRTLIVCFQRRHLFDHQAGIVDQRYIDKSGDNNYQIGQRIKLNKDEISKYIEVVNVLCDKVLKQGNNQKY